MVTGQGNGLPGEFGFYISERQGSIRPPRRRSRGERLFHSFRVMRRDLALSFSKSADCSAAKWESRTLRLASVLMRKERLSKLAEPTETHISSTMRSLLWSMVGWYS